MQDPIPEFDRAEFLRTAAPGSLERNLSPLNRDSQAGRANHAAYLRAIVFGVGAAIAGCVLYAVVQIATGWTIGYVALAVGYLVGKAMKYGSSGRGGRRYQIVAALLTYAAVSIAAVPVAMHAQPAMHPSVLLILFGLASPLLDLAGGFHGIIGLFLLFIGIRAAWQLTAGSESAVSGGRPRGTPRML